MENKICDVHSLKQVIYKTQIYRIEMKGWRTGNNREELSVYPRATRAHNTEDQDHFWIFFFFIIF